MKHFKPPAVAVAIQNTAPVYLHGLVELELRKRPSWNLLLGQWRQSSQIIQPLVGVQYGYRVTSLDDANFALEYTSKKIHAGALKALRWVAKEMIFGPSSKLGGSGLLNTATAVTDLRHSGPVYDLPAIVQWDGTARDIDDTVRVFRGGDVSVLCGMRTKARLAESKTMKMPVVAHPGIPLGTLIVVRRSDIRLRLPSSEFLHHSFQWDIAKCSWIGVVYFVGAW
jgi:hypothetical protein